MANAKGSANLRNMGQGGKIPLLPPKCPFPVPSPSIADYSLNPSVGHKVIPKSKEGNASHQRTSSEGFLVDEQPSWLDDLLNEPETPVRRGHRRSSSDSFAYIDVTSMAGTDYVPLLPDERKRNSGLDQLWGSQKLNQYNHALQGSFSADFNTYAKPGNRPWELPSRSHTHFLGISSTGDNSISLGSGPLSIQQERGRFSYAAAEKQVSGESSLHETQAFQEKKDGPHGKMLSESDTKNAKQKFAQRSRVRKLQYIAELERNVQAIQAEGSDESAELEFVNQQHLILSMENKALKQRLESLAQEHLIKRLEHEVLEREITRLRAVYQLQKQQSQQPPQQLLHHQRQSSSIHRRSRSIDLDAQFSSLGLKHREAGSGNDSVRT